MATSIRDMVEAQKRAAIEKAAATVAREAVEKAIALVDAGKLGKLPVGMNRWGEPASGCLRIMAYAEGYAMVRNKGAVPFAIDVMTLRATLTALLPAPDDARAGREG